MVTPISTVMIQPMIQNFGGRKRVTFLTGGTDDLGRPNLAWRKPQQRNWNGVSVWCVQYSGLDALVDPIDVDGKLVPQIAYSI